MPLKINKRNIAGDCFIGERPHPGGFAVTAQCLEAAPLEPRSLILDMGCGSGKTAQFLRQQGFRTIGFDIRRSAVEEACRSGVSVMQADWLTLPLRSNSVDAVTAECTFSLIQNLECVLRGVYEVLRPGGWLLFNGLYRRNAEASPKNLNHCLRAVQSQAELHSAIRQAGLTLRFWQDQHEVRLQEQVLSWQGEALHATAGQTVSGKNLDAFDRFLAVANLKLGYYAAAAQKQRR